MSSLSSAYTPALNLSQTPASVSANFNSTAFPSAVAGAGSTPPVYAPGGSFNLPTPQPLQPLDTSSPQSTLSGIESQESTAYNQGVTANQDLLKAITGGYQSLYGSQMQGIQNYGQNQENQLAQLYAGQKAQTAQQLVSSGLNNTTVNAAEQLGNTNAQALASNNLGGQIQQMYLNTQQTNAGNYLNALQGVNLQYPTLDQIGSQVIAQQTATNSTPPNPYLLAGAQGLAGGIGQYLGGGNSGNGGAIGSAVGGIGSLIGSLL